MVAVFVVVEGPIRTVVVEKVAAQGRFVQHHVPVIRVRRARPGVAAPQRHPVHESESRRTVRAGQAAQRDRQIDARGRPPGLAAEWIDSANRCLTDRIITPAADPATVTAIGFGRRIRAVLVAVRCVDALSDMDLGDIASRGCSVSQGVLQKPVGRAPGEPVTTRWRIVVNVENALSSGRAAGH